MTIWIFLLVLIGGLGYGGRFLGATRLAVHFLGVILGTVLAYKLGPSLQPMMARMNMENPMWIYLGPPVIVFVVTQIVFGILAHLAQVKLYLLYKYKRSDEKRVLWERMNANVGTSLGVATGVALFAALGGGIYVIGHWTTQLTPASEPSVLDKGITPLRAGLSGSGLLNFVGAATPVPEVFFDAADVAGILYSNPGAARRAAAYPGTISLSERPDVRSVLDDTQFKSLWSGQNRFDLILRHPSVQTLFQNESFRQQLATTDWADMAEFLKTGVSPKYADNPLLGQWDLSVEETVVQIKRNFPNVPVQGLNALVRMMVQHTMDVSMFIAADNRLYIKGSLQTSEDLGGLITARPARRLFPRLPGAPPQNNNPAGGDPAAGDATPEEDGGEAGGASGGDNAGGYKVLAAGSWSEMGDNYAVTFEGEAGGKEEEVSLREGSLYLSFMGGTLVFQRVPMQ